MCWWVNNSIRQRTGSHTEERLSMMPTIIGVTKVASIPRCCSLMVRRQARIPVGLLGGRRRRPRWRYRRHHAGSTATLRPNRQPTRLVARPGACRWPLSPDARKERGSDVRSTCRNGRVGGSYDGVMDGRWKSGARCQESSFRGVSIGSCTMQERRTAVLPVWTEVRLPNCSVDTVRLRR